MAGPADGRLLDDLKRWRNQARNGKPAYTVLSDQALTWIATNRPRSLVALTVCPGIGPTKLERYGADLLALVDRHRTDA